MIKLRVPDVPRIVLDDDVLMRAWDVAAGLGANGDHLCDLLNTIQEHTRRDGSAAFSFGRVFQDPK